MRTSEPDTIVKEAEPSEAEENTIEEAEKEVLDLSKMTKKELLNFAEEAGIDGVDSQMTKAEIMEVVQNYDGGNP